MARQLVLNPGFELMETFWTFSPLAQVVGLSHTGNSSAQLLGRAEISQFIFGPLTPGALLRFSFFVRKPFESITNPASEIRATVNLFTITFPFVVPGIEIIIPPSANPFDPGSLQFTYYEGYSDILPFGIVAAQVTIVNEASGVQVPSIIQVDDVFLVEISS